MRAIHWVGRTHFGQGEAGQATTVKEQGAGFHWVLIMSQPPTWDLGKGEYECCSVLQVKKLAQRG